MEIKVLLSQEEYNSLVNDIKVNRKAIENIYHFLTSITMRTSGDDTLTEEEKLYKIRKEIASLADVITNQDDLKKYIQHPL